MAQLLNWHGVGDHVIQRNVNNMVLFPWDTVAGNYGAGVPWNGIVSVDESPKGGDANPRYADGRKYVTLYSDEELDMSLTAFMNPPEFDVCDGSSSPAVGLKVTQQNRTMFALCYRTEIGDEVTAIKGHNYHFVYGCKASPSAKSFQTTGESPDALNFSWTLSTTKVDVPGSLPSSHLIIDGTKLTAPKLEALQEIIYGEAAVVIPVTAAVPARMPTPTEILSLLNAA